MTDGDAHASSVQAAIASRSGVGASSSTAVGARVRGEPDPEDAHLDARLAFLVLAALGGPVIATLAACYLASRGESPAPALVAQLPLTALFALVHGLYERRPWAWRALLGAAALLPALCGVAFAAGQLGSMSVLGASLVLLGLTALGLLGRRERAAFARGRRAPVAGGPPPCGAAGTWTAYQGFLLLVVGLAGTQALVRRELGLPVKGEPVFMLMLGGALAGAIVVAWGIGSLVRARVSARRDPELLAPATRARIVALRREGRPVREVVDALVAEGHASPEGPRFSGWLVRRVLRAEPVRPV